MSRIGPCMCGATDCPSCGPAQGYEVVRRWDAKLGRYVYVNPEPEDEEGGDELTFDEGWNLPDDCAAEKAADRWEQDRDRRAGS